MESNSSEAGNFGKQGETFWWVSGVKFSLLLPCVTFPLAAQIEEFWCGDQENLNWKKLNKILHARAEIILLHNFFWPSHVLLKFIVFILNFVIQF